jgi:hypothetical protein
MLSVTENVKVMCPDVTDIDKSCMKDLFLDFHQFLKANTGTIATSRHGNFSISFYITIISSHSMLNSFCS